MSAPLVVAVAASGGRDSTALLHATVRAAAGTGLQVLALHVHHGLSPHAQGWWQHVQRQVARWARSGLPVRFEGRRLAGRPGRGESIEAWARRERYAALAEMAAANGCRLVLLAQHRRDQAETFLLQALRGAGPAGLSAMPSSAERGDIVWARPWLDHPRSAIDAYVRRHRLAHIEDESNEDTRFARNRLRRDVWPPLIHAFADAEGTLAAAARRAQEVNDAIGEWVAQDLALVAPSVHLDVAAWLRLSAARRVLVLRAWLARAGPVPETLVRRLADELPARRAGDAARWPAPFGQVCLYRGALTAVPGQHDTPGPSGAAPEWLDLRQAGATPVPDWGGRIQVAPAVQGGVAVAALARVQLRQRSGGERFQRVAGGPPRALKKQYQGAGVPAWARRGPLLFDAEGALLFVPGLGVDARCLALPGEPQRSLAWVPRVD